MEETQAGLILLLDRKNEISALSWSCPSNICIDIQHIIVHTNYTGRLLQISGLDLCRSIFT